MELISRRDAGRILVGGAAGLVAGQAGFPESTKIDSKVRGVQIGAQSYSFRDRALDPCIEAYKTVGLGECELWSGHLEPRGLKPAEVRKWHQTVPLSHFHDVRRKFEGAGVSLFAYTYGFRKDSNDEEIERGFQEAKALGVRIITSSANVSTAARVDKFAQKYGIAVGFHGHDQNDRPDEFSTADTFARAMKGASKYIGVNLDIGHFTAAGGDPVAYIREHHAKIVCVHIKDRKKNHGDNLPFGQGETPIIEVLRLLRDQKLKIPANIEYEYGKPGMDTIAEVKKCYEYMKKALES
jgi:sugar phosphate isomerase/epimerase